jgi:hypothetical protein
VRQPSGWVAEDEEGDNAFFDEYRGQKDGSRRDVGKHGRSAVLTRRRNYAKEARSEQRGGS